MGVLIDEKMNQFYSRFNIKKELSENDSYDLLCTRVKDSIKCFEDSYVRSVEIQERTIDTKDHISNALNDYYGYSIYTMFDIEDHIDSTDNILDVLEFIQLYLAIVEDCIQSKYIEKQTLKIIVDWFISDIEKSKADVSLVKGQNGYILLPSGAKELDEKLVIDNLIWLVDYKQAHSEYEKALTLYVNHQDIRLIADSLRLCLETFLKEFFNKDKHLDNLKADYRSFLEGKGIAPEIRNMFESCLAFYINYNNDKVKHNNKVYEQEVEFLIYQTGIFLRMFITLENSGKNK